MSARPLKVVWSYEREHRLHPFIVLGLETLTEAGFEVTMVAADPAPAGAPYASFDDFSFKQRHANWIHLTQTLNERIKEKEADAYRKIIKARKHLKGVFGPIPAKARRRFRVQGIVNSVKKPWHWAHRTLLHEFAVVQNATWDTWRPYVKGLKRLWGLDADVFIGSRTQGAVWVALLAKLRGKRYVYFPFEIYGEQSIGSSALIRLLEKFILRFCVDAVITQNACRAKIYVEERGSRRTPLIVHNYKRAQPLDRGGKLRAKFGLRPETRVVLYEGLLIHGRWLEHVANAVLHLPQDTVVILMGQEKMKWLRRNEDQLKAARESGRLIIAPPVPHDDLPDYVADADVGVIIYDDAVRNNYYCEPGKLTDYISVGVPVTAPNFPTIGPVVEQYGIGKCFDGHSPQAIARTIQEVLSRPKSSWAEALRRACSGMTWETQAPQLIAAVTGEPAPAPAAAGAAPLASSAAA